VVSTPSTILPFSWLTYSAIRRHDDSIVILQIVHFGQLDDDARVVVAAHEQVFEMIDRAHGAVVADAADHSIQLIVDALVALGTLEIFRTDFAVQVQAIGSVALGLQILERFGLRGRVPLLAFTLQLRFDDAALLAVAVQFLELLARPIVEALRTFRLGAFGFVHGPVLVGHRVTDLAVLQGRAAFLQGLGAGRGQHDSH
jgi:hypothetical protein